MQLKLDRESHVESGQQRSSGIELCFVNPIGYTGAAYYDCALTTGLESRGCRVHLLSPRQDIFPEEYFGSVQRHDCFRGYVGNGSSWRKPLALQASFRRALATIDSIGPSLVHYEFPLLPPLDYWFLRRLKRRGYPLVFTVHDAEPFYGGRLFRRFLKRIVSLADALIVHTEFSRRSLLAALGTRGSGDDLASRCHVIPHPNYVPTLRQVPSRQEARESLDLAAETPVLLFFGGLREEKGLEVLLRALPRVKERLPDIELLVAGSPPRSFTFDLERHRSLARSMGIEDSVRWDLRRISHEGMLRYYRAADLVVLPYRRIDMSGVLLQAMTLGCPVVASDVGGFGEVIEDGVNGRSVPAGDPGALSSILVATLEDREAIRGFARAGQSWVREACAPEEVAARTEKLYREVVRQKRSV